MAPAAPLILGILGLGVDLLGKLGSKEIDDPEALRLMHDAMGRLKAADTNLDAVLEANDRESLADAATMPEPTVRPPGAPAPVAPAATTPPNTAPAQPGPTGDQ